MHSHFRRELFIGLAVLAGSIILLGAGIFLLARDISAQADKISGGKAAIARKAAALTALANLKSGAPKAAKYKDAMEKILVARDQILNFPKWLEGIARGRDLAFAFSFQGSETGPQDASPGHIAFSVNVSGALDDIKDFLEDAEFKSPKFLVDFGGFELSGGGSDYRMTARGKVYFR